MTQVIEYYYEYDGHKGLSTTDWKFAQTFTIGAIGLNTRWILRAVKFRVARYGSPGDITISIETVDDDGKPTGTVLTSQTFSSASLPTDYSWYTFNLPSIRLQPSTQYAIVITPSSPADSSNQVSFYMKSSSGNYSGGAWLLYSSGSWGSPTSADMTFEVDGDLTPGDMTVSIPNAAYYFTGGTEYLESSDSVDLDLTSHGITLSCWVKPLYNSHDPAWASWQLVGKSFDLGIHLKDSTTTTFKIKLFLDGNALLLGSGNFNSWYHVVGVWEANSTTRTLYLNGEFIDEDTSGSVIDASGKITIGKNFYTTVPYGTIANVKIFNKALTAAEVKADYLDPNYTPDSLILWYKLFNSLDDEIGGNTAVAVNNPSQTNISFDCWCSRWDRNDYSVVIETWLNQSQRNLLRSHIRPGAVAEMYQILGRPHYYDTSFGYNTLTITPKTGYQLANMEDSITIGVRNYTERITDSNEYFVKIEGFILD